MDPPKRTHPSIHHHSIHTTQSTPRQSTPRHAMVSPCSSRSLPPHAPHTTTHPSGSCTYQGHSTHPHPPFLPRPLQGAAEDDRPTVSIYCLTSFTSLPATPCFNPSLVSEGGGRGAGTRGSSPPSGALNTDVYSRNLLHVSL